MHFAEFKKSVLDIRLCAYPDGNFDRHYSAVAGWFNFPALYNLALKRFRVGTFVEVGSFLGRSAIYMAHYLDLLQSDVTFYCVDTWCGPPQGDESYNDLNFVDVDTQRHIDIVEQLGGNLFPQFWANVANCGVQDRIKPIQMDSVRAAKMFDDDSLEFVCLDGDHSPEGITADIEAWLPKVKKGGILGGDDYDPRFWPVMKVTGDVFKEVNTFRDEDPEDLGWYIVK